METNKNWYAVYTRAKWEKKVSNLLSKHQVENFCPLNKVIKQWADRKKTLYQPLFTCYVFVHVANDEHIKVKQTDGILNFVHWQGKPAIIKDEEIEALKNFLNLHQNVSLEKINVNVNDKVKIISGALTMKEGNVLEVRQNSVKVLLPSLGYALVAEVSKANIEILNTGNELSVSVANQTI